MGKVVKHASKKYAGIYWIEKIGPDGRKKERQFYIRYRRGGRGAKLIDEPVGGSLSDGMTERLANDIRADRRRGAKSNTEKREAAKKEALSGSGPMDISRAWSVYLEAHKENKSIKDDLNRFTRHVGPALGKILAAQLQTAQITKFRQSLEKSGLSAQSVKHCMALVKRVLRYAAKLELIKMPGCVFDMPRVDNCKTENMTPEQWEAYWRALNEEKDRYAAGLLTLALLTGMRRGALFALQWDDLDFEANQITLRGEAAKNGRTAKIPMNAEAKHILQKLEPLSKYVFPGKNGEKRRTIQKIAQRVRDKAGLPKTFRPLHGLRHTFASWLASSGKVTMFALQELMTHESPAMTRRYTHLHDEALAQASNVMSALVPGREESEGAGLSDTKNKATGIKKE